MRDGKCPKCGSDEVYVGGASMGAFGVNTIPVSTYRVATLTHYVCTVCGYTESYIKSQTMLRMIAEKWRRAGA